MLRDSDSDLSLDQRVAATNLARPWVFISLHAEPGASLHIYTPVLPAPYDRPLERSTFLPWQSAQGAFSAESGSLASAAEGARLRRNDPATAMKPPTMRTVTHRRTMLPARVLSLTFPPARQAR